MEKIDALYIRVSTDQQVERGESLETQKSRLSQYAKDKGLNPKVYEEAGFSAGSTNRPAYQRLLADIKEGKVASVTVTKLDRISRNLRDVVDLVYETFEDHSVAFRALDQQFDTSTPMGRVMVNMLATLGQWERETVSERVRIDMHHRAAKGKWNGGPVPFGYTTYAFEAKHFEEKGLTKEEALQKARAVCPEEKVLYPHPKQALLIKKIFEMYLEGKSQRRVTHWLNTEKFKTARGETWATSTVSRILKNPVYVGKMIYGKRISLKSSKKIRKRKEEEWIKADGIHSPIIDEATFRKVQEILRLQSREPVRFHSENLLSGLLRCGKCGGKMHGYYHEKNGHAWSYYRCTNHTHKGNSVCKGNSVDKVKVETAVIEALLSFNKSKAFVKMEKALEVFNKKICNKDTPLKEGKEKLEQENKQILKKKSTLLDRLEDETIGNEDFKDRVKKLDETYKTNSEKIQTINDQLGDLGIQEISFNAVYSIINDFSSRWKHCDFQGRRTLLISILQGITYTDPDTPVKVAIYYRSKDPVPVTCLQSDTGSSLRLKEN